MDPFQRPAITHRDVEQARLDQIVSTGKAVGTTLGLTGLNYRLNAPGGPVVQKPLQMVFTGVKAVPTEAGRAALSFPKLSVVTALLPGPIGYVPAEWYGLHPSVVRRSLGFSAGNKPVYFEATEARVKVFHAQLEAERIAARALNTNVVFGQASGFPLFKLPAGRLNITPEELAYLESLPPGVTNAQRLIPDLQARRGDFLPSELPAVAANPPSQLFFGRFDQLLNTLGASASIQPEGIRPVNAAALRNEEVAEGIRQVLVSERADP